MPNKLQIGANITCRINGQDTGIVFDIQYSMSTPHSEDRGIDSLEPFDLSPNMTEVMGTIQVYMLRNDEGLEGRNVTAGLPHIPEGLYFSLQLEDRDSGFLIFKADHCVCEVQQWRMATKSIVVGQFSFKGLTARTHMNQR